MGRALCISSSAMLYQALRSGIRASGVSEKLAKTRFPNHARMGKLAVDFGYENL
jgi:hypothetical protein